MRTRQVLRYAIATLAVAVAAALPSLASAQASPLDPPAGQWRFAASVYLYVPSLSGSTRVPADAPGTPINVSLDQIIDKLDGALMGSFDAHNGRWGVFTDLVYVKFSDSKDSSRDFTIGEIGIPVGTTATFAAELEGLAWTLAGTFRVASKPGGLTMDALAGLRLFDVQQRTQWSITGDIGPIAPEGRTGDSTIDREVLDAVVGIKGRAALGSGGPWGVPFYADVGTGDSDLTWQVAAGVSYAFKWGELNAMWRYLAYEMKPGKQFEDVEFNGPMVGVTFRW
jgi:hypothetical protein